MRHNKSGRKLGRKTAHRKALMSNLASALITHKKIKTTDAKAKELRMFIEPLVTKAKKGDLHSRRMVLKKIRHKKIVRELFDNIGPSCTDWYRGGWRWRNHATGVPLFAPHWNCNFGDKKGFSLVVWSDCSSTLVMDPC